MALGEQVVEDYTSLRLSLKAHPLSFLSEGLVIHLGAEKLTDMIARLHRLTDPPAPQPAPARNAEIKRPTLVTNSRDFH